jgi:hypothetical protein
MDVEDSILTAELDAALVPRDMFRMPSRHARAAVGADRSSETETVVEVAPNLKLSPNLHRWLRGNGD